MLIKLDINKTLKDLKEPRTNFYPWKDLEHLKKFYEDVVDGETINHIAEEIREGKRKVDNVTFKKRKDLDEYLNERGLCNLVEMVILENDEALDVFLQNPVYSSPKGHKKALNV
ncbi:MAG: hypothetical protein JW881_11145 [Spirochaetales bacterium]|nr:hypothetical protein [Spirochaetales bacterium]